MIRSSTKSAVFTSGPHGSTDKIPNSLFSSAVLLLLKNGVFSLTYPSFASFSCRFSQQTRGMATEKQSK